MIYRVLFKSHSLGMRVYHVETSDKASAFFVRAALENTNWHTLGVEEIPEDAQPTGES